EAIGDILVDHASGAPEAIPDELGEQRLGNRPDVHAARASPERLVAVVEDRVEDVPSAPEVHVTYLGLRLEHRPHEVGKGRVELHDLLELVEDEHHLALPFDGDSSG